MCQMPDLPLHVLEQLIKSQPRLNGSYKAHLTGPATKLTPEQSQMFLDRFIETYTRLLPNMGLQMRVERDQAGATIRIETKSDT